MDLARRVLAIVARIHFARLGGPYVGVKESRMISLQNRRHTAQRRDVRRREHEVSAGLQNAIDLTHQVHRIFEQVLDQLAAEHRGEVSVGVRKAILLRVEMIDVALEGLAFARRHRAMVRAPERAVVAAADLAIAELRLQARA